MPSSAPKTRTGGRSARVKRAVLEAALVELTQTGAVNFSIASVAWRAGVHPTSIYRRWGDVATLLREAALQSAETQLELPTKTQDLADALATLLTRLADYLEKPAARALLATANQADSKEMERFWRMRLGATGEIFSRAAARGEIPPRKNWRPLVIAAIGPLYFYRLAQGRKMQPREIATHCALIAAAAKIAEDAETKRAPTTKKT
jgi:AcrR family transcriptional regulator